MTGGTESLSVDNPTGVGWHALAGAGIDFGLGHLGLTAGLYLSRQEADLEGRITDHVVDAKVDYQNVATTRLLLAVGVGL